MTGRVPGWLIRWFLRARATVSARHDRELRDELQLHLQLLEEQYTTQGIPADLARQRAHREFGNATLIQENSHDMFSFRPLEDLVQDLRYAMREMRRSVGFTVVAVLSLAVGIGAVTAAFTVIDAFLVRGLPVREPDKLMAFSTTDSSGWVAWPYAHFARWRDSPAALFEVAASSDVRSYDVPLRGSGKPGEVRVSLVSSNYFEVMGVDIAIGRALTDADDAAPGVAAVAVISEAFWQRWFGRTRDVLTKTIDLHGVSYEVVGVVRNGFTGHSVGHPSDVWIPLTMQSSLMPGVPALREDRWGTGAPWLTVIGRLRAGVSVDQAAASASLIRQRFVAEEAAALGESSPEVTRERRRAMFARSEGRRREFVIRLALGGGRWRLIRQSATECVVLAVAAGLLGLLFAEWATMLSLKRFAVMIVPLEFALELDARVLTFTGACVAVAILFGLWPCTGPARSAAVSSVYHSSSAHGRARTRAVGRRVMLVAQLVMCTILLIGAGLLLRTVTNLRSQDLGFDRNVLLVSISPGQAGYSEERAAMLLQRVRERLSTVPGIKAVGLSGSALLDNTNYWIDGSQRLTTDRGVVVDGIRWTFAGVGQGFFEAVGMSLLDGRTFDDRDAHPPADIVVINRSLATFVFGSQNPIGRRIRMNPRGPMQSVIGVVNDAKQTSPRDRGMGVVYLPLRTFSHVVLAVRTTGAPADAAPVIRHELGSIAADLPAEKVRTITEVLDEAIAQERLMSAIALFLGALVVAIGCVGLYALMAYDVARRTRELGIRLALGATSRKVVTMVLRDCAALVLPGLAIGVPLGMAASGALSSQLYGVEPGDPWTLASVALLLAAVGLLATFGPAQTASRIDPIALLRNE